ncbi:MAG: DUF5989 family protein [Planctomycetota bacterium]
MSDSDQNSFEQASQEGNKGLVGEFVGFMKAESKWWLTPFLIVFGVLALVLILGATGAAPFIYTLF